jgi:DNA-binding NarL/FixJ family response regulator
MQDNRETITIVIIHDQALIRESLVRSLDQLERVRVVGEAQNSLEGAKKILEQCADVALLDIDLALQKSISLLTTLVARCPKTRVLLLTSRMETSIGRKALELGVSGIFQKDQSLRILIKAIEKVHAGEIWMDRSVIAAALNAIKKGDRGSDGWTLPGASELTPRELEVISNVCEGLRTREIADRLYISEKTVRNHLASIFSKLDVSHRLELSVLAQKHGLARKQTTA